MPTKLLSTAIGHLVDEIVIDIARGLPDSMIAKRHKVSKLQVERTRTDPALAQTIDRAREKLLDKLGDDVITIGRKAASVLDQLMDSEQEEIRLRAASKVLDHVIRFRQQADQHRAMKALRDGQENAPADNVIQALSPELVDRLLKSGAALKALDLSKVPTETIRLVMREISISSASTEVSGVRPTG